MYYEIKKCDQDFTILENILNTKGTRPKKNVIDKNNQRAIFKYEHPEYHASEAASEKLSYEIAKILNYDCATIELAYDKNKSLGILNYLFVDVDKFEHMDAVVYLKHENENRCDFYTISNIKKNLDELNSNLFSHFIKIMIFDALVGEQDRHEENWGINNKNGIYHISPLYDNGCNLLREFKNQKTIEEYHTGKKDFMAYIKRSKTMIYKEDHKKRYKHFELVEELLKEYPDMIQKEINNLKKLTDEKIEETVNKMPPSILTELHKKYIIKYLIERRNILLEMVG